MTSAALPANMVADASAACVLALDAKEKELRQEWKAGKKDTRDRLDLVLGKLEGDRERAVRVGVLAEAAAHHSRWSGAPEPMVTVDAADFRAIAPWYGWSAHTHLPPLAAWVLAAAGLPVPHHPDAPPDAGDAAEHG